MLTVATQETDGFKQFMHSAKKYNLTVKVGIDVCIFFPISIPVLLLKFLYNNADLHCYAAQCNLQN